MSMETCREILFSPALTSQCFAEFAEKYCSLQLYHLNGLKTCREILFSSNLTSQWFEDLKRNTVLSSFNCFAATRVDARN
jgi:hypothetical protein